MKEQLEKLQKEALEQEEAVNDLKVLQAIQVAFVGRKGSITEVLRGMGELSKEERPVFGELANNVRGNIESAVKEKKEQLEALVLEEQLKEERIDVTLPGRPVVNGGEHVLSSIIEEIEDLFIGLGYEVREGPEVET